MIIPTEEQLKRREYAEERKELIAKKKLDDRRNFVIGKMICDYFPEIMDCVPRMSWKNEDDPILKSFENILKLISSDTELLNDIRSRAEMI